jgi:hypothetical protein
MLGGDDLSDITDSIAILDASVVHKTGNLAESINGLKTFTDNFTVLNNNTSITAIGTATDGVISLIATDPVATGLYGQITAQADTKIQLAMSGVGTSSINMSPASIFNITDDFSVYDTSIVNQLAITPTLTTNTNATITEVATTAFKVQSVAGTDKLNISPTTTTLTNPTTYILDGTGQGLQLTSALVELNATVANTLNLKVNSIAKLSATSVLTTLTNPTITNVATTAFKVQSVAGTDKFSITPTLTQFSGNPITLSVTGALNGTVSTFINIASTTSSAYSATTSLALTGGTSTSLTASTTNAISSSGAVSDAVSIDATSASGGIKMRINAVEKIFINSGVTTLTNTYTDIISYLYSQRYYIGTHSSNDPLSSCKFTGVVTLVPVGIGTSFLNANMYGGTTATTVPFNFVPTKAIIYGDGGTITGGGAMTVRVIVNNFTTSTDTANTANVTLTSGIRSFAVMPFTTTGTLPIGNEMIIKSGIVASAAITGATLTLQITIFGYQV